MKKSRRLQIEAKIHKLLETIIFDACGTISCIKKVLVTTVKPGQSKILCRVSMTFASQVFAQQTFEFLTRNCKTLDISYQGSKKEILCFLIRSAQIADLQNIVSARTEFPPLLGREDVRVCIKHTLSACGIVLYGKYKDGAHVDASRQKDAFVITLLGSAQTMQTKKLLIDALTEKGCRCLIRDDTFSIKVLYESDTN